MSAQRQGYAGIKANPLETRATPLDRVAVEHSRACAAAIREAAGPELEILLDTHGSPVPELSVAFARAVAPCARCSSRSRSRWGRWPRWRR